MALQSDMGGVPGGQPKQVPEDLLDGDERPGQRNLAKALQGLAMARNKRSMTNFLNVLGERDATMPAVQGEVS